MSSSNNQLPPNEWLLLWQGHVKHADRNDLTLTRIYNDGTDVPMIVTQSTDALGLESWVRDRPPSRGMFSGGLTWVTALLTFLRDTDKI